MKTTVRLMLTLVLGTLAVAGLPADPRTPGTSQESARSASAFARAGKVALTFDDGPDPRFTPAVLRTLNAHGARATFFVVGSQVRRWPSLVRALVQAGNELGNHTYYHGQPPTDVRSATADLRATDRAIRDVAQVQVAYFRPPRGRLTLELGLAAACLGYRVAFWDICLENHSAPTPELMAARVLSAVHDGSVVLLHDGSLDRSRTVKALPLLLDGLERAGYAVVPLSGLSPTAAKRRAGPLVAASPVPSGSLSVASRLSAP